MDKIKCITFDKAAQNALPEHIKAKMKADREKARLEAYQKQCPCWNSENNKDMSEIKQFKLVFNPHPLAKEAEKLPNYLRGEYAESKQAKMFFENGYGISVLFGSMFYSNGVDSYEVGVLKGGTLCYDTPITNDVIGYIPAAEVSDIMRKIQELPIY